MALNSPERALAGKVLVVIGGTAGLGLSGARAFIRQGARIVVVGLESEGCRQAGQEFGDDGLALCADATDPKTAPAVIQAALTRFGDFHGLYHVAGGSGRRWGDGLLHELTDAGWEATLELNLSSVMYSNRAAVQYWLAQGKPGSVLNLSSVLAFSPSAMFFATHAYATAKAAILGLTKAAAAAYASSNIRFNALAPGLVATPMSSRAQADEAIRQFIHSKQPLDGGRIGRPEDLDALAVFFMGDASRFTTGQVIAVDGGWSVTDGQVQTLPQTAEAKPVSG